MAASVDLDFDSLTTDVMRCLATPSLVFQKYQFSRLGMLRRGLFIGVPVIWLPILYANYVHVYYQRGATNEAANSWPLPPMIFLLLVLIVGYFHFRDAFNRWNDEYNTFDEYPPKSRLVQWLKNDNLEEAALRWFDPIIAAVFGILVLLIFHSFIGWMLIISAVAQTVFYKRTIFADEEKQIYADGLRHKHREDAERLRNLTLGTPTVFQKRRPKRAAKIDGETKKARSTPRVQAPPRPPEPIKAKAEAEAIDAPKSAWQLERERRKDIATEQVQTKAED